MQIFFVIRIQKFFGRLRVRDAPRMQNLARQRIVVLKNFIDFVRNFLSQRVFFHTIVV